MIDVISGESKLIDAVCSKSFQMEDPLFYIINKYSFFEYYGLIRIFNVQNRYLLIFGSLLLLFTLFVF